MSGCASALLALALAAPGPGSAPSRIAPEIVREGARLTEPCELRALRAEEERTGPAEAGVEVSPGAWWVVLACPDPSRRTVLVPGPKIEVRPGETARPRVRVSAAPLRVEAVRNGEKAAAEVYLRLPGLERDLLELDAQSTTWVGRGPWSVRVATPDATRRLTVPRWRRGRKTTVLTADLSDGEVVVRPRLNGRSTEALVRVLDDEGELGPTRDAKEPLSLPPGSHRLQVTLAEAADAQASLHTVEVEPKRRVIVRADFEGGWLDVRLHRAGAPLEAPVQLARSGAGAAFGHLDAPGRALLRPGRVRAWTEGPHAGPTGRHELGEVEIARGRTERIRVDLTPAEVRAEVEGGDAKLVLRRAGGGEIVTPASEGLWRPWAGRYELVVTPPGAPPVLDGPFEVELGGRVRRVVKLETLQVSLRALRGGQPLPEARLWIYRAGAGEALLETAPGRKVELLPGRYDIRARAQDASAWRRGVELREPGTIDVQLPSPEVDAPLPDGEAPLPEGDAPPE